MGSQQDQGQAGRPAQPDNGARQNALPLAEGGKTAGWLLLVRVLLAVAVLGAGYLAYVSFSHGPVAGCGAGSGCDKVLQSRWAYWLGIPVSLPAVLVYLGLLAATLFAQKRPSWADQQRAWAVMIILSVVIAGAATWFIGLQAFVIKSFCKFCMTAHTCGLIAAVLCLKNVPRFVCRAWTRLSGRVDRRPVACAKTAQYRQALRAHQHQPTAFCSCIRDHESSPSSDGQPS
ncbi:MAG: vitamin K epoxide reductase family protein [Verrucomicrobia bacterium]|nr:vitamin K epoxide reductase family protein [Verrucomicrobiota bacterium]